MQRPSTQQRADRNRAETRYETALSETVSDDAVQCLTEEVVTKRRWKLIALMASPSRSGPPVLQLCGQTHRDQQAEPGAIQHQSRWQDAGSCRMRSAVEPP